MIPSLKDQRNEAYDEYVKEQNGYFDQTFEAPAPRQLSPDMEELIIALRQQFGTTRDNLDDIIDYIREIWI